MCVNACFSNGCEKKKSCAFGPLRERDRADDCSALMGASIVEGGECTHTTHIQYCICNNSIPCQQ